MKIPVNVITGFLGSGKTTALLHLLRTRPAGSRWAVLVNEFGDIGLDGAALAGEGVAVREVAGGCICCSANVPMRVALTGLLRRVRPERLLIEPSGLGHPAGVMDTLRDPWLAHAITPQAVVCLLDPRQLADPRVAESGVFRDQIELADVLVASKTDLCDADALRRFEAMAAALYPPKLAVAHVTRGGFDPALLDLPTGARPLMPRPHLDGGATSHGWVYPADAVFDTRRLRHLFDTINQPDGVQLPGLLRAKGVFHGGREWLLANWVAGQADFRPVAWRRDSRVEWIVATDAVPDWCRLQVEMDSLLTRMFHKFA